jgi:hypothetical protein
MTQFQLHLFVRVQLHLFVRARTCSGHPRKAASQVSVGDRGRAPIARRPRTDPDVRLSCIRLPPRLSDGVDFPGPAPGSRVPGSAPGACRAGPLSPRPPVLGSSASAPGRPALFGGLDATMTGSDFSRPVRHRRRLLAFPMRTGAASAARPDPRSPRYRRSPFARDAVFDPGAATASCLATPQMSPSLHPTSSAHVMYPISRFNSAPTQSACTLRLRRRRRRRNTRYQAGASPYLGRTSTGWIPPAFLAHWMAGSSRVKPGHERMTGSSLWVGALGAPALGLQRARLSAQALRIPEAALRRPPRTRPACRWRTTVRRPG